MPKLTDSFGFFVMVAIGLDGCSAAHSDGATEQDEALSDPVPADDENLQYVKANGFGGIAFAVSCVSKSASAATIEGESLPVGGGRWLECSTARSVKSSTHNVLSAKNVQWCVLGALTSEKPSGDSRLAITVLSAPARGPWTLKATHDGAEIQITPVSAGFGATTWPLWVDAVYRTSKMKVGDESKTCAELFGL